MSEFDTDEDRHQAAIEVLEHISALHSEEAGRCKTCGYLHPCKTAQAIQTYRNKFFTRTDAILDAIYQTYPSEDLDNRAHDVGILAERISEIYLDIVNGEESAADMVVGILRIINLDKELATKAFRAIVQKISLVRS